MYEFWGHVKWSSMALLENTVSTVKRPNFILFSVDKEKSYGLIIGKYHSHSTPNLILKIHIFQREHC
jgi:hypothetical protein